MNTQRRQRLNRAKHIDFKLHPETPTFGITVLLFFDYIVVFFFFLWSAVFFDIIIVIIVIFFLYFGRSIFCSLFFNQRFDYLSRRVGYLLFFYRWVNCFFLGGGDRFTETRKNTTLIDKSKTWVMAEKTDMGEEGAFKNVIEESWTLGETPIARGLTSMKREKRKIPFVDTSDHI